MRHLENPGFSKPTTLAEGYGKLARWTSVTEPSIEDRLFGANDAGLKTLDEILAGKSAYVEYLLSHMGRLWPEQLPG
jgi:hypothetical protein